MKRTVRRWTTWGGVKMLMNAETPILSGHEDYPLDAVVPVDLTFDDGEPENVCGVCKSDRPQYRAPLLNGIICANESFHDAQPKTRDRVVEGCVYKIGKGSITNPSGQAESFSLCHAVHGDVCQPATLIIHEPVKEPTLLEAAEKVLSEVMPGMPQIAAFETLRLAVARERKANGK